MIDFLDSLKADLLDRRLLPLVALVSIALVGAIAYVVLGGGSAASAPASAISTSTPVTASAGVPITAVSPEKAVAETTSGTSVQHQGDSRDPFLPVVQPKAAKSSASSATSKASSTASGSSSSSAKSGSGSSSQGSGGSGSSLPAPASPTPSQPAKPKTIYHVAVLFGALPESGSTQSPQLTPYESLKLLTPLPSAKQSLIVFRGATVGGKSATFTLVSEAILHGNATCLPSASQCQAIDLQPGQAEKLEILSSAGQVVVYELKIVSIVAAKASSAAAARVLRGESKAGRELLSHAGLLAVPGLRYSAQAGVLVFAGHHPFGVGADAVARRHRS